MFAVLENNKEISMSRAEWAGGRRRGQERNRELDCTEPCSPWKTCALGSLWEGERVASEQKKGEV